jgi:NAD(P)-dependent dehydrogenase (short-subunit alcohol dehydrogenase family)
LTARIGRRNVTTQLIRQHLGAASAAPFFLARGRVTLQHCYTPSAGASRRVVEAFEDLVKRGGVIGVMSSGLGSISWSDGYLQVYSTSKAALNPTCRP